MKQIKTFLSICLAITFIFCIAACKDKKSTEKDSTQIEKSQSIIKYICSRGGLRMRDKPNLTGKRITTIPNGEKVEFLEETGELKTISGTTGKWTKINRNGKIGWVFGGFLCATLPSPSDRKTAKEIFMSIKEFLPMRTEINIDGHGSIFGTPGQLNCEIRATGSCTLEKVTYENDAVILHGNSIWGLEGETKYKWKCTLTKGEMLKKISEGGNFQAKCDEY